MGEDNSHKKSLSFYWVAHWSLESMSSVDNFLEEGSTFLNPLCTWTLTGALGMEKSSCVSFESVKKKINLNWKIFSLVSNNSNMYFDMQWWNLKTKWVPSRGSFLTALDIFSFSSLMKKKTFHCGWNQLLQLGNSHMKEIAVHNIM